MPEEIIEKRLFTPLEAQETLPLVKRVVSDILSTGKEIKALDLNAEDLPTASQKELKRLSRKLQGLLDELELIGCSYKDWNFEMGLIDFPALLDGEPVMLCWRSDEPEVKYYHGIYEGYASRKEIPMRFLSEPTTAKA